MDLIINRLLDSFDLALMLVINVITYGAIKILDELGGKSSVWKKRLVFVIVAICTGAFYNIYANLDINVVINSCIASPVAWSWIAKPVAQKLGIDYKHE